MYILVTANTTNFNLAIFKTVLVPAARRKDILRMESRKLYKGKLTFCFSSCTICNYKSFTLRNSECILNVSLLKYFNFSLLVIIITSQGIWGFHCTLTNGIVAHKLYFWNI